MILLSICAVLIVTAGVLGWLIWNGTILLNNPSPAVYPVRGVDVSAHQGEINWELLSQNIDFAFIKATEGSSFTDKQFSYNDSEAQRCGLRVGAYHFFSYDSSGEAQAAHFISTVEKRPDMLPPVIDVEFYGDYNQKPADPAAAKAQLTIMIRLLREHYGLSPILYATERSYRLYLENDYAECDIWIRNIITEPKLPDGREWTFWQYTDRAVLKGYNGPEKYIDINVFNGSSEDFQAYGKS